MLLERAGVAKHISMYKQRRWTKLGHDCAVVLNAWEYLVQLLEESAANNLLARSCRLFLSSDVLRCCMEALAYVNHTLTLPFLNLVSSVNSDTLLVTL